MNTLKSPPGHIKFTTSHPDVVSRAIRKGMLESIMAFNRKKSNREIVGWRPKMSPRPKS